MQGVLHFQELLLHYLNLLCHHADALVPLLYQLTELLNGTIFLNNIHLHELHLLILLCRLAQEICLVSLLCLPQFIDFTLHIVVLLNSITHLFFNFLSRQLELLGHLMSKSRLQLSFFLDQPLFFTRCTLQLGLQFLVRNLYIEGLLLEGLDTIVLDHE